MACSPYKWLISGGFLLYKWGLQITNYTKWDPILQVGLGPYKLLKVGVIMFILYWSNWAPTINSFIYKAIRCHL